MNRVGTALRHNVGEMGDLEVSSVRIVQSAAASEIRIWARSPAERADGSP